MEDKEFKNLIKPYNNNIKGVIKGFFPSPSDMDDVEQEVYIKTWKNLSKFRGESSLWGWIRKITVNTCINHINSSKKHQNTLVEDDLLERVPDKSICPENKVIKLERQKFILSKINKLKPKLREVIIFHDIDGLTYEEISKRIKCPVGTVKSRLFNARRVLSVELSELLN